MIAFSKRPVGPPCDLGAACDIFSTPFHPLNTYHDPADCGILYPARYFAHDWTFTVTVAALTKTPVLVYHALGPQHHWHVHLIDLVPNGKFHAQREPRRSPACFGYTSARVKYASLRVLGSTPMTKGRQSWHVLV